MSKSRDIADSAATINYIDNVTSDVQSQINTLDTALDNISVTSGTLTKTFTTGESSTINLTSSVLAPVVSVTKEVPQTGVTNNNWDVNSTSENYTRLNSAYATTLDWAGFDVSAASFVDSFSVAGQETLPSGISFNTDGTKMFIVGYVGDDVNEYTLSSAFDISSASFVDSFSVAAQDSAPFGMVFNPDGTKMYIVGLAATVFQYTLSTGFDVSTASYASISFSISGQEASPRGIAFNTDGTKMFIVGSDVTSQVYEYTLSTGFNVSTASFVDSFNASSQDTELQDVFFNTNGTKMFLLGTAGDSVYEYNLSTGFDVSTASYTSTLFSVASQDIVPNGLAFNTDGTKMFIVGNNGDAVYEYTIPATLALGTGSFASADVGKTIEANSGAFVLTAADGSFVETTAPTSYNQVASGAWSMYGVVYNAADGDLELSNFVEGYSLAQASYDSVSFDFSAQETNVYDITFNNNGTKAYIVGAQNQRVYQYSLSTANDISTASYDSVSFHVASQDTQPYGLCFNNDGTKMYIVGSSSRNIYQYTLSTAFDISTASYDSINFSVFSEQSTPVGIVFNLTGTKMFISGYGNSAVSEYILSTAFNVSSATYNSGLNLTGVDTTVTGLAFSDDGLSMFVSGYATNKIYQYSLSVAFDLSTATYSGSNITSASPVGLAFTNNGFKMYAVNYTVNVLQYSTEFATYPTGYHPVHTTASTNTTEWVDINSMTADQNAGDGNVYYAISTDDRTTWTVIDNTDGERDIVRSNAGTWQYNSNGTYASETWTNATTNTELAALAEAMEGAVGLANQFDVSTAVYDSVSFSAAAQDTSVVGLSFNSSGTKMYVLGGTNKTVFQYSLSTAYDASTASYDSVSFSVAVQITTPYGMTFSSDGSKMYIVSLSGDAVYQYTLSTNFDLSTASYLQNFSVAAQDANPIGIAFSADGNKMFVVGNTGRDVNEYTLSTGFDISTASFVDSFSVAAQETSPHGIAFNTDGTKMFIVGITGDDVNEYTLSTGFDVSTASFVDSFSVAAQDTTPRDVVFNNTGSKMFVLGAANNSVFQYSVGTTSYTNQMDKTQLDAVTDPNHIALGNDLDLAIVFNMTSGTTVPSSDGVAINYDANVLNKGAVLGTDYDFDAPAQNKVRITALAGNNLKVRVV